MLFLSISIRVPFHLWSPFARNSPGGDTVGKLTAGTSIHVLEVGRTLSLVHGVGFRAKGFKGSEV